MNERISMKQVQSCVALRTARTLDEYNGGVAQLLTEMTSCAPSEKLCQKICNIIGFRELLNKLYFAECAGITLRLLYMLLDVHNKSPKFTVTASDFEIISRLIATTNSEDTKSLSALVSVLSFISRGSLSPSVVERIQERPFWCRLRGMLQMRIPGTARLCHVLLGHLSHSRRKEELSCLIAISVDTILSATGISEDIAFSWKTINFTPKYDERIMVDLVHKSMEILRQSGGGVSDHVALSMINTVSNWKITPEILHDLTPLMTSENSVLAGATAYVFHSAEERVQIAFFESLDDRQKEVFNQIVNQNGNNVDKDAMLYTLMIWNQLLSLTGFYSQEMIEFCCRVREISELKGLADIVMYDVRKRVEMKGGRFEEEFGETLDSYDLDLSISFA